ncbi:MAG: ABC transporter ATP-binding protein [Candidatus Krumholzibacteriota bacterium]|nr:ABC transporter ATP-binding protein [Candidatus Krumholzibacteriota bacterium]
MITRKAPVLNIENLSKNYGRTRALRNINIVLDSPGVYGFLGPNGAGKTTTFKLICALLKPSRGRILIGGKDVQKDKKRALSRVGVQFDSPAFYPYLTGSENLRLITKWSRNTESTDIEKLLTFAGLRGTESKKVKEYSWGMKQRLGLVSALIGNPELLLLDEPTNGLDPAGIANVREFLPRLAHEEGRTLLLASHRMEEVEQVCDKIIIINKGIIVASGKPSELSCGKTIELVLDDTDLAVKLLKKHFKGKGVITLSDNKIQLIEPGLETDDIKALLRENSIDLKKINKKRESLESVFLRLTKEDIYES